MKLNLHCLQGVMALQTVVQPTCLYLAVQAKRMIAIRIMVDSLTLVEERLQTNHLVFSHFFNFLMKVVLLILRYINSLL